MTLTTYHNFDLLLTRAGVRYKAIVVDAPAGEESILFDPPFAADALPRLEGLARGVTRSAARQIGVADDPDPAASLADVGSRLFDAVFGGPVGNLLAASLASVAAEGAGLRLRLRFEADAAELALLPWETLYDPAQGHFVGLGEASPVLRYLALPRSRSALPVKPPLRVLAVLASPDGLNPLDVAREWQAIQAALAGLVADGKFVLERLASPTLDALQQRLLGEPVHILHFIGHGVFDEASQAGCLAFADARNRPYLVRGDDLAKLLRNHPAVRLAYLNACEGALASGGSVFTGVAQSLVREGVPAAVAMQAEISDPGAVELARTFYTALAAGRPVDAALTQARVALSASGSGEWAIPVLFSRSPDNRLFDIRQVLPTPDCPYPGMVPFSEAQRDLFFGRDREIEEATARLRQHPFLAVIGPSGSGKSSLIYAGVIPALRSSRRFGPGEWAVKIMRPGQHPLASLDRTLPPARGEPEGGRTLLFVDQFEEVFTLAAGGEAQSFLDALGGLVSQPNLHILLTARADFYPELMACSLWPSIKANRLELTPLGDDELWAAIVEPANRVGVTVDEALAVKLIADAAGQKGVLPLVQETLVLLWDKVAERQLGLKAYQAMAQDGRSGLQVAIDRRASIIYDNLPAAAQAIARRIFLRLVQFGEGRADTRRQQTAAELRASGDDPALFDQTLARLTESRLLTASGEEGGARRVDIAHEALIAGWPRLQEWLGQRRTAEQTRRRLEAKATEWVAAEQRGGLLDEYELQEAENWLAGEDAGELGYSRDLDDLVKVSKETLAQAAAEKEAQRQRELEQAQKLAEEQRLRAEEGEKAARGLRRRLILVAAIGAIAIIVAVAAFWFARQSVINKGIAINERQQARAGELAANAQVELAQTTPDHSLALLLATESSKIQPPDGEPAVFPASFRSLAETVAAAPAHILSLPPHLHSGAINSIAFSPLCLRPASAEGQPCPRALLTASEDETARLWDPETLEQLGQFLGHDGPVRSAHFSPDGNRVLTVGADGTIRVWSVAETDRHPQVLRPPDEPQIAGFTPDGQGVVTVRLNGVTRVWNITTGRETHQIQAAAGAMLAALSPDGAMLAAVTDRDASSVLLIEVASGAVRQTLPVGQEVFTLEFLHEGKKVVVTSVRNDPINSPTWETTLWSVTDGRRIENPPPDELPWRFADEYSTGTENPDSTEESWKGITLSGRGPSGFSQVASSEPAGGFVAAGGSLGEIVTWRLPITRPIAALGHVDVLTALAFGANDEQLLIGSMDGRLSLWDITAGKQLLAPFGRHNDAWVNELTLSEDGLLAAATSWSGLGVWDTRSGKLLKNAAFSVDEYQPDFIHFVPSGPGSLNPTSGAPGLLVYDQVTQTLFLYDPRSDTIIRTFEDQCEASTPMAVSQDGTTLAMNCTSKGIHVWQGSADAPTITSAPPLDIKALHSGGLDGSLLLLDSEGWIWNRNSRNKAMERGADTHIDPVYAAVFSPDGSQLAVVSERTGAISLVSTLSGVTAQTWRHGSQGIWRVRAKAVAFSSDGRTLATVGDDARVRLWDVSPGARYRVLWSETPIALPASYCAASSGDDACRTIVAELPGGALGVWELAGGQAWVRDQLPISRTLGISPDGRYLIVQANDKRLCAWSTAPTREVGCLPVGTSPNNTPKVAIGGSEPTLASWDGHDLRLWRLPGFDLEMRVPISGNVSILAFSPSAPVLATGTEGANQVTLWAVDGREARMLHRLASPGGDISRLAFSPDGGTLWIASGGQTSSLISRWQTASGQELSAQRLRVDTSIMALVASPRGDRLAASGADGMIYLWDVTTGKEIGRLNADLKNDPGAALAFTRDGSVLFSTEGQRSAIRIWPMDLHVLLEQAAARISRDPPQFTGAERRRYGLK